MRDDIVMLIKRIIKKWPAYRRFIEGKGIDPLKIDNISDLSVMDKKFIARAINTVPLFKVRSIVPSSGSTGVDFSFGLFGEMEMKKASIAIENFLQNHFNTSNKKTLILNLLPGAILLQSATATVVSIGIRMDTAISVIKSLGSSFEQIILIGEPLFIKGLIESGLKQSILWQHIPLFIIVGGEWISESYRAYLENIVGYHRIYSSMGMAELGLNYFYETDETIMLRRLLFEDGRLLRMLLGDLDFCPMLFAYDEEHVYVETIAEPNDAFESILLTTTDPMRVLPLIRYKGGDKGKKLSRAEINNALKAMGYGELLSKTGLPILAHFGRGKNISGIYPEVIKDIIYSSRGIASSTTGNFILNRGKDKDTVELGIQLKENVYPTHDIKNIYRNSFNRLPVHIELYSFDLFLYPLNFERKVRYVNEGNNRRERRREEIELSAAV
jgi:phenylacetate-CoA ligase